MGRPKPPRQRHGGDAGPRADARENRHAGHAGGGLARLLEEDLYTLAAARPGVLLLVLDGVQDPHNLGACLRSADGAGVTALVIPKDRAAPLTETVVRIACGAAASVPVVAVTNLARCLERLREECGVRVIGTSDRAAIGLYDCDLTGPLAITMGSEEKGLRRLTEEHCDRLVRIPMLGAVECLNVSNAAAVCLFEAVRQRRGRAPQ